MKIKSAALVTAIVTTGLWASTTFAAPVVMEISGGNWSTGSGWGAACTNSACDPAHSLLNVSWTAAALLGTTLTFNNVMDSQTIRFGSAKFSEENGSIDSGEVDNLSLSALLQVKSLALPNASIATVAATLGVLKEQGSPNIDLAVSFAPIAIQLADGSLLDVSFSGLSWNCQGTDHCTWASPVTQNIDATFTLTKAANVASVQALVNNVPEPSSMLLFGAGIAGLGFTRRRKTN
ncbi:PEP-CTERM sorting domain-containing protein [Dechloromonas sp. XY25]|uniref:PEP-CTERM sorting domain-containing protein n=1 Tax=Dechloromonas hankyongensis TaxID=2908002 RepID=A0ABS9JWZ9_9RHOO|nr:PEP-CTERM sorting domain-containing protein [Dechloromonas hankyongensis]MCG2575432.1 PEP-CTERM sorting domain-containing protein [Dechloromonas hankyongensis]